MPALYQRARPVRFDQVVGQEHVVEVLGRAVRVGRIGHAYLFSGPRGVGKTTTARLLAMAANCEAEDASARPCGTCESCRLVQAGAHPDVTELDAASNNSVDDVRDLREKVGLAGMRGGMRVWILDEAHMLSRAAANALLKTLEEPPPGLLFVLATTEPEKLPPTILSRCQHFRFRRLSDEEIEGKLTSLCLAAGVPAEQEALRLVARVADGGMRDAESMLERLLVLEGGVTAEAAEEALGLPPQTRLQAMATALAQADLAALLGEADALYRAGFSPRTLAEQLGRTLRDALVGSVQGEGFSVPLPDDGLMRVIQALDDDMDRFLRHDDLYALEVALIKALNAARGRPADDAPAATDAARDAQRDTLHGAPTGSPRAAPPGAAPPAALPAAPPAAPPQEAAQATAQATSPPSTAQPNAAQPNAAQPNAAQPKTGRPKAGRAKTGRPKTAPEAVADRGVPAGSGPAGTDDGGRSDTGAADAGATDAGKSTAGEGTAGKSKRDEGRAGKGEAGAAEEAEAAGDDAPPRKPLAWREVKAKAGPQLKAFLKPAQESLEGDVVRLRYDEVHKFHHGQLLDRADELAALVHDLAGPGYTVVVEGPEGGTPKKIA